MRAVMCLFFLAFSLHAARVEPRLSSIHPFTGKAGATFSVTVRGTAIKAATAIFAENTPFKATVEGAETEPAPESSGRNRQASDLVKLRIESDAAAKPGKYQIRLLTPGGVSNALPIYLTDQDVVAEPDGSHESASAAVPLKGPGVYTGRLSRRGEADYYSFDAAAGERLTFEAISGLPSIGAAGGNAVGFDPSLSLYEPSGSWFDPNRLNRIAFNDEPLWVIGTLTDPQLVHTFRRAGRYFLRIEAFQGLGGGDFSYQLRISKGDPKVEPRAGGGWEERGFARTLSSARMNQLAGRGGRKKDQPSAEIYRSGAIKLPAIVEGTVANPGETQRAQFRLDAPKDIAIEVETPAAAPPLFNPVVRLLGEDGEEVATNVLAGRGACTGALSKSIQAKTIIPLRNPGEYTVEIRDTTADLAGADFRYRVMIRPQVPHVGQVRIAEDHVNLAPAEAKTTRVVFDREEDYRDAVSVSVEDLPAGVQAFTGADYEPDKDPPMYPGKRERYIPRTERTVVVFNAAEDAEPMAQPRMVKLVVRPVVNGKLGEVLMTKRFPLMVVPKQ